MAENPAAKAVVLLSGGMDSAVCLYTAQAMGFSVYAISFRYGQRHHSELQAAEELARSLPVAAHLLFDLSAEAFAGSALTDSIAVPKTLAGEGIPVTYVPARNTVFLSVALAWAESMAAKDLFIGVNAVDYSGYPDCRPAFIAAFEQLANLATKEGGYRIHAPLQHLSKAEIVRRGIELGVDFSRTRSCYDPDAQGRGCGGCAACQLRLSGFAEAGMVDPLPYRGMSRATGNAL
ncbi:7-cyano-7-deazaguanine synthase QueC [Candidatus Magnetaquicoccus inordinatus]|uniref:7-cyano-7-deazaguanine synthase QueC n=1 Tax=Candidatus Magnetaquicoccus inordinatus TaxID=2496818 RepID=UPI00102C0E1D|nr:7-cyano-7-deazaguanine synthase QueC [Candidatus Magnetaquicoccus inordinatus]